MMRSSHQHGENKQTKIQEEQASVNTPEMQRVAQRLGHFSTRLRTAHRSEIVDKKIALLGSTGFLGPWIAVALLRLHPGSQIICVNRRKGAERQLFKATPSLLDDSFTLSRLQFHVIDVTDPRSQSGSALASLISGVDEVVFNSWSTDWAAPLLAFEPFLEALHYIIDLSGTDVGPPRITFISSISAVGNWPIMHPQSSLIPEEVIDDMESALPHGYGESKWVAEHMLGRASKKLGLRVNIIRPGQIGGPADAMLAKWPRQGWLYLIIRESRKRKTFPANVQPLDWIPVDALAQGIAETTKGETADKPLRVFNMVHTQPADWDVLRTSLEQILGLSIKSVGLPLWLSRTDPQTNKLYGFLRSLGDGREQHMTFQNRRAAAVLPPLPKINEQILGKWMESWGLNNGSVRPRI
ncbi:hypothetical protein KC340_g4131 [Hortaea werneckii]|nr:hypothetical protein KC361_g9462 [Hortaea werneckii]KAI6853523.1 hypothetical protein KC323_g9324 [Hortaea werneckii]KAI6854356.1 hypothetical protein KC338_g9296 [Hortaea werneckii]KAI7056691.1 hypothetical protein KC339_g18120 [Hortaea werneckii]KAI7206121.1 hypothetical protein KC365_g17386 [Hortaea werneckii]